MRAPQEKAPLFRISLAASGTKGADAEAGGHCVLKHGATEVALLFLVRVAIDAAQAQLSEYALATDDPLPGTIEAADLLDAARAALDGAP